MTGRFSATAALFVLLASMLPLAYPQTHIALAQPPAQKPTEEPTRRPYVFPTPIFIPTYPGDTPAAPAPSSAGTKTTPLPSGERTYTVVAGDNPWNISMKVYGVGTKSAIIMAANGISDPTRLKVGMVLKIPSADSTGALLPTAAPRTPLAQTQPNATPVPATPLPTQARAVATPAPAGTGLLPRSLSEAVMWVVNLLSFGLVTASALAGALAFFAYRRSRRFLEMTTFVRQLWIRQASKK